VGRLCLLDVVIPDMLILLIFNAVNTQNFDYLQISEVEIYADSSERLGDWLLRNPKIRIASSVYYTLPLRMLSEQTHYKHLKTTVKQMFVQLRLYWWIQK
jgi:hypothetical protein